MPARDSPQSNKQHAVPQNIMDVEFKLIGDLTMRQFVYLLIFIGLAYFLFTLNISIVFRLPLTLFSALAGLALAFMPLEDRGLDEWVVNFFNAVYSENQMVWRKDPTPPTPFVYENLSMVKQELITLAPTASRRKLEKFLEVQEQKQDADPFEKLQQEYVQKVQEAYSQFEPAEIETSVTTIEEPAVETSVTTIEEPAVETSEVSGQETPEQEPREGKEKEAQEIKKPKPKSQPRVQVQSEVPLDVITPDRHTGRKFTNLLPDEGSITLPIRGEKVISTESEPSDETSSVNKKAEQLRNFISQIESADVKEKKAEIKTEGSDLIEKLKNEKEELGKKIEALEQELAQLKNPKEQQRTQNHIRTLMDKRSETSANIEKLEEQITSLKQPKEETTKKKGVPEHLKPDTPNVVAGVVRNIQGKRVSDILIVIKTDKDDPVRAVKTNQLGEFSISNPLPNGKYKMEIDVNDLTGFNFDIIDFVAEGKIIPAMEIIGK